MNCNKEALESYSFGLFLNVLNFANASTLRSFHPRLASAGIIALFRR